jgi:hypothetical protein
MAEPKKKKNKNKKDIKISTLSDGTILNEFCMDRFNDLVASTESIWDLLDVVTKLSRIDVVKNDEGFVTDVELVIPRVNEIVVNWTLKNLLKFHEEYPEVSAESLLELRRLKLEKYLEE